MDIMKKVNPGGIEKFTETANTGEISTGKNNDIFVIDGVDNDVFNNHLKLHNKCDRHKCNDCEKDLYQKGKIGKHRLDNTEIKNRKTNFGFDALEETKDFYDHEEMLTNKLTKYLDDEDTQIVLEDVTVLDHLREMETVGISHEVTKQEEITNDASLEVHETGSVGTVLYQGVPNEETVTKDVTMDVLNCKLEHKSAELMVKHNTAAIDKNIEHKHCDDLKQEEITNDASLEVHETGSVGTIHLKNL